LILALLIFNIAFWLYIAKEKKGWSEPTPTSTDHPLVKPGYDSIVDEPHFNQCDN
jgi:hypothetical protein